MTRFLPILLLTTAIPAALPALPVGPFDVIESEDRIAIAGKSLEAAIKKKATSPASRRIACTT